MSKSLIVYKCAGGIAAQVLCLANALQVKQKKGANFKIKYFPHSTGTYWPFGIAFLLSAEELLADEATIRGLRIEENLQVGKVIENHPLEVPGFSYERLLKLLRKVRLDFFLRLLRGEMSLKTNPRRLRMVSNWTCSVSGGYVPISDKEVFDEIDRRFKNTGRGYSPFSLDKTTEKNYIAIHYRIGDKRAEFTRDSGLAGDGIFDPESFKRILDSEKNFRGREVYVVSDEPKVAQNLLNSVGITAHLFNDRGDIWKDLYYLTHAKLLIGSWSQVSQLAASVISSLGGNSFLPSQTRSGISPKWKLTGVTFFDPLYLEKDHEIYTRNFHLPINTHRGYKNK